VPGDLLGRFQPLVDVVEDNSVRFIGYGSLGRRRRRALGAVPQFQMAQDSLDDAGAVDQTDDFERAAATRANPRVRFVHLLDEPRPGAPQPAREVIGATGMLRPRFGSISLLGGRRTGTMSARAAHVRECAGISDQLLSGIRNMSAQRGEEIDSRDDRRRRGIGRARPAMIPGIVGDLGGFRLIAQTIECDGRMEHVPGQPLPGLVVVWGNGRARIYGKAGMTPRNRISARRGVILSCASSASRGLRRNNRII